MIIEDIHSEWCDVHADGKSRGCDCSVKSYKDLWWSSFCGIWTWISHNNALVEVNKFLIDDLAKSEELLERATAKLNKKWTLSK